MPVNTHEGRVAIVTGAVNGIGRAIALELGKRGARLVLVDLEDSAATAAKLDSHTLVLRADVSKDADWQRVVREVDARFGRCDIVVNNAAYMQEGTIDQLDYATWRRGLAGLTEAAHIHRPHTLVRRGPRQRKEAGAAEKPQDVSARVGNESGYAQSAC
jgi:NAD(P)-dependent dehydrogenase (short-subunit alcohol dehydrogenase family)